MKLGKNLVAGSVLALVVMVLATTGVDASFNNDHFGCKKDPRCECSISIRNNTTIRQVSSNEINNTVVINSNTGKNDIEKNYLGKGGEINTTTGSSNVSVWIENRNIGHNSLSL